MKSVASENISRDIDGACVLRVIVRAVSGDPQRGRLAAGVAVDTRAGRAVTRCNRFCWGKVLPSVCLKKKKCNACEAR